MKKPTPERRREWFSSIILAVVTAPIHISATIFETKIPGDLEWLLCFLGIAALSFLAVQFNPNHFLETGAMPFLGSLLMPNMSSFVLVLPTGIFFAFLGAVVNKVILKLRSGRK